MKTRILLSVEQKDGVVTQHWLEFNETPPKVILLKTVEADKETVTEYLTTFRPVIPA